MKFDRKSYEEENTEEENAKLNKVELNNEGFYQFATIEGEFTPDKINFFIRPVITVTYYKTDNYEIGGNKLTGKIKYTSDFKYKLYAGDYNKQAKDKVPFGISIPVSSLKTNNVDYIYWPYETQPIWAGYPNFSDWLSENNDGSWIKNPQVEGTFNDTWNASLLIKGEATSNLKLPNVNKYASELKAIEAKMIQEKLAKESEEVKETEME